MKTISVLGSGSWGTALAIAASNAGNQVLMWSRSNDVAKKINSTKVSEYLPQFILAPSIIATGDLRKAIQSEIILIVTPAQAMSQMCNKIKDIEQITNKKLVICCKGIEQNSLKLMSEIINEILPNNKIAVLSGPSFADGLAKGDPTATTLACEDKEIGMDLVNRLGSRNFRPYYNDDIIAAQICGSLKNVVAIACGIAQGLGYGENTKVAIVTRGMKEISKLCAVKGGKNQSLMGLCGIGDMMLTCGTSKSRNMSLGVKIGEGGNLQEILNAGTTVEGYATALSISQLAQKLNIDMPICQAVKSILHDNLSIEEVINSLLKRPFTSEII